MSEDTRLDDLRVEITRLLEAALATEERHAAEIERRDVAHLAETARRDELHVDETRRRDDLHAHELDLLRDAIDTRDIIGQAKGVIMVAMACPADKAFELLRKQSQYENRKVAEIAAEIASRAAAGIVDPGRLGEAPGSR